MVGGALGWITGLQHSLTWGPLHTGSEFHATCSWQGGRGYRESQWFG